MEVQALIKQTTHCPDTFRPPHFSSQVEPHKKTKIPTQHSTLRHAGHPTARTVWRRRRRAVQTSAGSLKGREMQPFASQVGTLMNGQLGLHVAWWRAGQHFYTFRGGRKSGKVVDNHHQHTGSGLPSLSNNDVC